jgi:two-component system, sensor histidine kinase and response regulator
LRDLSECAVLVVDDTETNIDILVGILEDDYKVAVAMDGESVLECVGSDWPDLILLDVMMPGIDGYEVCRRLKKEPATQDVPIIMVTAMGEMQDETKGLELGAVDYITKPISAPILKARVRNHLELALSRESLREQNRELQESYEKLRELERLRDSLVHMVIHDMRSPLMGVCGTLQMVLPDIQEQIDEEDHEDLQVALAAAMSLSEMVSSLLDVSRMEAGEMPVNKENTDLAPVAGAALASLGGLVGQRCVVFEPPVEPVLGWCDAELIRRVITNLVGNAIKFTPSNGVVTVEVASEGGAATVRVIDTGPGIPPEYRTKIFEKFGQVGEKGESKKFSTGLGLAFCSMAVEAHGGEIGVGSVVGEGSTFWFTLPASPDA